MENKDILESPVLIGFMDILRDAALGPWQLLGLILGGLLIWRLPSIIRAMNERHEINRQYDVRLQKNRDKMERIREKKERKHEARK